MSFGRSGTKAKDLTPGEFKGLRGSTAEQVQQASLGQGEFGAFQGPVVAGITQGELGAIGQIGQAAGGDQSQQENFLRGLIGGNELDFQNDPNFNQVLDFAGQRFLSGFDEAEEAQKALFARAGQQVQDSSPFSEARGRISQAKATGLSDIGAQLIGSQLSGARDRQFNAVGQLSNLETTRLERARAQLEAEALPRLIEDLGIERGRAEFARRQELLLRALGLQAELASPKLGSFGSGKQVGIL